MLSQDRFCSEGITLKTTLRNDPLSLAKQIGQRAVVAYVNNSWAVSNRKAGMQTVNLNWTLFNQTANAQLSARFPLSCQLRRCEKKNNIILQCGQNQKTSAKNGLELIEKENEIKWN